MLFGGDFRQTLPIVEKATAEQLLQIILKASDLWTHFKIFKLKKNMRANEDEVEFAKEILEIGDGKKNDSEGKVLVPDKYLISGDLVTEIFRTKIDNSNIVSLQNSAILATTNKEVYLINDQVMSLVIRRFI